MFSRMADTIGMVPKRFEASLMDQSMSKNLHKTQKMKNSKKYPNQPKHMLGSSTHHLPHPTTIPSPKICIPHKKLKISISHKTNRNVQWGPLKTIIPYPRTKLWIFIRSGDWWIFTNGEDWRIMASGRPQI